LPKSFEFDVTNETQGKVTLINITLNRGVVLATNLVLLPTNVTTARPLPKIVYAPLPEAKTLAEGVKPLNEGLEAMHDSLAGSQL
jgi:hypothetical protein